MDKLSAFGSFVLAVNSGSFSGAARKSNLSQPAISQQISSLETHFGTQLLLRSRNGVQMTQAGEILFKHALVILEENANLTAGLNTLDERVAGRLVVTANFGFSQYVLPGVIVELASQHPDLEVILRTDNRILDLGSEGIDVAIRSGSVGNSDGIVRKIAVMKMLYVATPQYLDQSARPKTPDELVDLDYIRFDMGDDQIAVRLQQKNQIIQAPIKTGFIAQNPDLLVKAIYGELGFARMPEFLIAKGIEEGRLEVVLPNWSIPDTDLFLVLPNRESSSARYLAFINVLFEHLERVAGIKLMASASRRANQNQSP